MPLYVAIDVMGELFVEGGDKAEIMLQGGNDCCSKSISADDERSLRLKRPYLQCAHDESRHPEPGLRAL